MTATPAYGWYGDDFTGATDTLATIARRGYKAFLFLSVPEVPRLDEVGELDAIGIAGAARAMAPAAMEDELRRVGCFFRESGVSLLHYKCCSTFDSAPHVGNIAVAVATLKHFVDDPQALMSQMQAQHHQILDAIVAGDADEAARVTEEHIRFAASRLPGLSET